jgi:hypothetical protein
LKTYQKSSIEISNVNYKSTKNTRSPNFLNNQSPEKKLEKIEPSSPTMHISAKSETNGFSQKSLEHHGILDLNNILPKLSTAALDMGIAPKQYFSPQVSRPNITQFEMGSATLPNKHSLLNPQNNEFELTMKKSFGHMMHNNKMRTLIMQRTFDQKEKLAQDR